ncbi:hypothetical protein KUCAC02_010710 [Chaenocephalus aceratus]|uniref:Uncharacterized protein n=1 Tax=Chaenocephalus aceratus TaxID=36190 RepID=A0ACB9W1I2_CHAAC|nr:hypothetical protein KUCAC02_010710 [Chaenocephalus aceratus]
MEDEETTLALIRCYCYEKYFNHAVNAAAASQRKFSNDPIYMFFHAYGNLMQDQIQEASIELDTIRDSRDVSLCTLMALVFAEKKKTNPDKEVIQELDAKVKDDRKSASPKSLYYAGMFLWLLGRNDKAREYTERMIKLSSGSREGIILKAWIDVTSGKDAYARKAGKYFDEGLKEKADVFALMGKAQYYEYRQNYYPGLWRWLTRDGDISETVKQLSNLISSLEILEPHNPELFYRMSLAFTRVCGRNEKVIEQTFRMVERAFSVASETQI